MLLRILPPLKKITDLRSKRRRSGRPFRLETLESRQLMSANHPLSDIPALNSSCSLDVEAAKALAGANHACADVDSLTWRTLYLDFNGHYEENWGSGFLGFGDYDDVRTPVWDVDGDPNTFHVKELQTIEETWARVAEDFAPFNINVTTVEPQVLRQGADKDRSAGYAIRASIGGSVFDWFRSKDETGAGGVAHKGTFYEKGEDAVYVFENETYSSGYDFAISFKPSDKARKLAGTISHEAGHSFGLEHQSFIDPMGKTHEEYHSGEAYRKFIMGAGSAPRDIWTRGHHYDKDSNEVHEDVQDDLLILSAGGRGYRADGPHNSFATAQPLDFDLSSQTLAGHDILEKTIDKDYYSFTIDGNSTTSVPLVAKLSVAEKGPNLDARLELWNEFELIDWDDPASPQLQDWQNDRFVSESDGREWLEAEITATLGSGTYYLVAGSHGDYGDVGQYGVDVQLSRPKVVASQPAPGHVRVTFDRPIDSQTFGSKQVIITNANGDSTTAQVSPVAGSDDQVFDINFTPFATGGYRMTLLPEIRDRQYGISLDDAHVIEDLIGPSVMNVTEFTQTIRVEFSEKIDPSTFTVQDVTIEPLDNTPPDGSKVIPVEITGIEPLTGGKRFDIRINAFPAGGYKLQLGPNIRDRNFGNWMDQDWDGTTGERIDDQFTHERIDTKSPYAVSAQLSNGDLGLGATGYVPSKTILLDFSEEVELNTLQDHLTFHGDHVGQLTIDVHPRSTPGSGKYAITLGAIPLDHYTLTVGSGMTDLFHNPAIPSSFDFDVVPTVLDMPIDYVDEKTIGQFMEIPLAVYTTDDFDAARIIPETVMFAGTNSIRTSLEDVDGDGRSDLLTFLDASETSLGEIYDRLLDDDADQDGVFDSTGEVARARLIADVMQEASHEEFEHVELMLSDVMLRRGLDSLAMSFDGHGIDRLFGPAIEVIVDFREVSQELGLRSLGNWYQDWWFTAKGIDTFRQEKWFQGGDEQWYFMTPEGTLWGWGGGDATWIVAHSDSNAYDMLGAEFSVVSKDLGFRSSGDLFQDWWYTAQGIDTFRQEKWFQDSDGQWYFMTPDGTLRGWGGGDTTWFVTKFDSSAYSQLDDWLGIVGR